MKLSGWIFMILSWGFILGLGVFCFSKIFKSGIDTEDTKLKKKNKTKEENK